MIPEMPALIPTNPGNMKILDDLKKKMLEQIKLVAALKHTLMNEQKKLQMLWKAKQRDNGKKIWINPSQQRMVKV